MKARSRTILLFLLHPGYLRPYLPVVEELVARGHHVRIAFSEPARRHADLRLEERASGLAEVTVSAAPRRGGLDGWRGVALVARALADAARYVDERYRNAPALRERAYAKIEARLRAGGPLDPITRRLARGVLSRLRTTIGDDASRRVVATARTIEAAVPTSHRIDRFIRDAAPDVVVVSPLVEIASSQVDYVKSAQRLGIPAVVAVASWDNLTNKGLIRCVPDRVVVWNEAQRREAVELHGIPCARVTVTGAQRFDEWFARKPASTRADLGRRAGLEPEVPYVLYVCSSAFITPNEVPFVQRWLTRVREDPELAELGVMVRPHPKHSGPWRGVDLSHFGNAVVWPPDGAEPDESTARTDFFDALAHASAVVGVNTSVLVEAAILRKPVLGLLTEDFEQTQVGTLHFHHLLNENGGILQAAKSFDEHLAQLRRSVEAPGEREAAADNFVGWFLRPHGGDLPVTPLVADAFLSAEVQPVHRPPWAVRAALRLALAVPALLGTATALVGATRGRTPAEPGEDA